MQRKSAIRSFIQRRKALEYELNVAAQNRARRAALKRKIDEERKEEQAQIKRLMLAELHMKARQTSMREKAEGKAEGDAEGRGRGGSAKAKTAAASKASSGGGDTLPVFNLTKKNVPVVVLPLTVKSAMKKLTDCEYELQNKEAMLPWSLNDMNRRQTNRALRIMSTWGDKNATLDMMYVRIDAPTFIEYSDDIFWALSALKRDYKDMRSAWEMMPDCRDVDRAIDRIDRWLQRADSRLMS